MAFEYSCNTYLTLGSTLNVDENPNPSNHNTQQNKKNQLISLKYDCVFPSLSLGLLSQKTSNFLSGVLSYSNSREKREREEEFEVERESSKKEKDDHDDEFSLRKKLRLTKQQSIILEDGFKEHSTLNHKQKQELAKQLSLRPRQVEVWFQNRRARTKFKQTELEYESMKKYWETLTDENKRLHKELQDLKTMMGKSSFYLQLRASTCIMCPSCEMIGNNNNNNNNNNNVSGNSHLCVGAKSQFYNTLTHPSAAC